MIVTEVGGVVLTQSEANAIALLLKYTFDHYGGSLLSSLNDGEPVSARIGVLATAKLVVLADELGAAFPHV